MSTHPAEYPPFYEDEDFPPLAGQFSLITSQAGEIAENIGDMADNLFCTGKSADAITQADVDRATSIRDRLRAIAKEIEEFDQ